MASIDADFNPVTSTFSVVSVGLGTLWGILYSILGAIFLGLRFLFICILALLDTFSRPIIWLLSPLIYLFSLLADALVSKPYNVATYLGRETRDMWVFFGVALLVGAAVGVCAGRTSRVFVSAVLPKRRAEKNRMRLEGQPGVKVEGRAEAGSLRVQGKKRVEWAEQY